MANLILPEGGNGNGPENVGGASHPNDLLDWGEVALWPSLPAGLDVEVWPSSVPGDGVVRLTGPFGLSIEFTCLAQLQEAVALLAECLSEAARLLEGGIDDDLPPE